ncbi:MAG: DUF1648 domain-containing protein [Clostridiales bacterium]|nr:DUF1648 domain-containing protein [Clostridiales bacterium]
MFGKKEFTVKYTPAALILEMASAGLVVAILLLAADLYPGAPGAVPRHFGAGGAIDGWGERQAALIMPVLSVYLYLILTGFGVIARRIPARGSGSQAGSGSGAQAASGSGAGGVFPAVLMAVLCIKVVFLAYALPYTHSVMLAQALPAWASLILPAGIGLTAALGFLVIRKNYSAAGLYSQEKVEGLYSRDKEGGR